MGKSIEFSVREKDKDMWPPKKRGDKSMWSNKSPKPRGCWTSGRPRMMRCKLADSRNPGAEKGKCASLCASMSDPSARSTQARRELEISTISLRVSVTASWQHTTTCCAPEHGTRTSTARIRPFIQGNRSCTRTIPKSWRFARRESQWTVLLGMAAGTKSNWKTWVPLGSGIACRPYSRFNCQDTPKRFSTNGIHPGVELRGRWASEHATRACTSTATLQAGARLADGIGAEVRTPLPDRSSERGDAER